MALKTYEINLTDGSVYFRNASNQVEAISDLYKSLIGTKKEISLSQYLELRSRIDAVVHETEPKPSLKTILSRQLLLKSMKKREKKDGSQSRLGFMEECTRQNIDGMTVPEISRRLQKYKKI